MEGDGPHLSAGEHLEPLFRALPTFSTWLRPSLTSLSPPSRGRPDDPGPEEGSHPPWP